MTATAGHAARAIALCLCLALAGLPFAASACSIKGGSMPTPEELVAKAEGIYLAQATAYALDPPKDGYYGVQTQIEFAVHETLKGPPRALLEVPGAFADHDDFNERPVPYTWVRGDGTRGSCFATTYKQGASYLLMLQHGHVYWAALMPVNEQVRGPDDAWVAWVRNRVRWTR